ncbi:MAG TPA: glycosyltransferase family 2 protein [Candidatus Tumulicola sp.]|jgi:cellulose synthase/poly-beta-1,6-N-acetylglucosamine synthase-like glycosyltransferase
MPDGLPEAAAVAVVPCFNEGRNPLDLAEILLDVPELSAVFVDDASEADSARALQSLATRDPRVAVERNPERVGKVSSLLRVLGSLEPTVRRVLLLDADVVVSPATLGAVLEQLRRADLVLVNAVALPNARTVWEKGAIFSANRHARLRKRAMARYPALFSNGRLLGMSRRLVDAVVRGGAPYHTEDAHFMLVCIEQGYRYAYLDDAILHYRAPETLADYLRQSGRFSAGRSLLAERWSPEVLARYYDPKAADLVTTLLAEALHDPAGACAFGAMLIAKGLRGDAARPKSGAWAVSASTKVLR